MSLSVINRVKYSPTLYSIYSYIGNKLIRLLRLVVRPNPKLIVFNSFGGRKYDDSTRCIYEKMIQDHRFDTYEIIWAFIDPKKYNIPHGKKIKTDTFIFFINVLKARCWITNSSMTRGLSFKGKNTFYFNTWHGTPIKLMGSDINTSNTSFGLKERESNIDIMLAQGKYEANIFSRVFNLPIERFRIIGLPRNDELTDYSMKEVEKIKNELHLPDNKKVILYAPTFREYTKDEIKKKLIGNGGYNALVGTNNAQEVYKRSLTDENVKLVFDAFIYQVCKDIGAQATVLKGKVDQIIITGGIAYNDRITSAMKERIGFIAPVTVYPGEDELLALAQGAIRVMNGEEKAKVY